MIQAKLYVSNCPRLLPPGGLEVALIIGQKKIHGRFFIDPKDDAMLRPGRKTRVLQQLVEQLVWCEQHRGSSLVVPDFEGSQHIEVTVH